MVLVHKAHFPFVSSFWRFADGHMSISADGVDFPDAFLLILL